MSTKEEVLRVGKKLEKMISSGTQDDATAKDLLVTLKKLPMTLDVLQKTHIGMTVNNFRKASSKDEVISIAKSLIKSWKKLLTADGSSSAMNRSNSTTSNASKGSNESSKSSPTPPKEEEKANSDDSGSRGDTPPAEPNPRITHADDTSDPTRLKCRQMITDALSGGEPDTPGISSPPEIAAALEDAVYKEFKRVDMKYKNRIRSRIANLKDAKNPQLKQNLLLGHITPEKLAVMTAEEMASDEMKALRAKFTKEAIDDHQMATTSGTKTDLLKCGRCQKRNCTYNQVQTRSADEPMTTFVFCNECGNRWKFC